jgi:hypothetical protein
MFLTILGPIALVRDKGSFFQREIARRYFRLRGEISGRAPPFFSQ